MQAAEAKIRVTQNQVGSVHQRYDDEEFYREHVRLIGLHIPCYTVNR